MNEERRQQLDGIRHENERDFGTRARGAVNTLLQASLPHPWLYVFELTQNACDAGAARVRWTVEEGKASFQHDGPEPLEEKHVRGLCSIGASTKGIDTIGFMGVGFKAVFARFDRVQVAGFGWQFALEVTVQEGDFGMKMQDWIGSLLPQEDPHAPLPEPGYTTRFELSQCRDLKRPLLHDLRHIAQDDDPTPLAVLALRGLKELQINGLRWTLSFDGEVATVHAQGDLEGRWQWRVFQSSYRPTDAAMASLLKARRQLHEERAFDGKRVQHTATALLPLDENGLPDPPSRGRLYATLPTEVSQPFGFHLQADWLVDITRQGLRPIEDDAWQLEIVGQVPALLEQVLLWIPSLAPGARRRAFGLLCLPDSNPPYGKAFDGLWSALRQRLDGLRVVPIVKGGATRFGVPGEVARLPGAFVGTFGQHPEWRADLLFGAEVVDEASLGSRGGDFARWLQWGQPIPKSAVPFPSSLPGWWETVDESHRLDALFALWQGVSESGWDDLSVVPTEAGAWLPAGQINWLNEPPPNESEPGGAAVLAALGTRIPGPERVLATGVQFAVNSKPSQAHPGRIWFVARRRERALSDLVTDVFSLKSKKELPWVELAEWALSRGPARRDFVPNVLTDQGPMAPAAALLADQVDGQSAYRRELYPSLAAVDDAYLLIHDDPGVAAAFLETVGVRLGGKVQERVTRHLAQTSALEVAKLLDIDRNDVPQANAGGFRIVDFELPFDPTAVPPDALRQWLESEYHQLKDHGRLLVRSKHHILQQFPGNTAARWREQLERVAWVKCSDGQLRAPEFVLLDRHVDFDESAPVAELGANLRSRLQQEGLRFGHKVPKSAAVRRLSRSLDGDLGEAELVELLEECWSEVDGGLTPREELELLLPRLRLPGGVPLDRLVQRVGSGVRSELGGWVVALSSLSPRLVQLLDRFGLSVPPTTTGRQALGFLCSVWAEMPRGVEALRALLASAYRYVLDDVDGDAELRAAWESARPNAVVFGQKTWHALSPDLYVDDVGSSFFRRSLDGRRVLISASHLGETGEQLRRVAEALGVPLLSQQLAWRPGPKAASPQCLQPLRLLLELLAERRDGKGVAAVCWLDSMYLQGDSERFEVKAFIDAGSNTLYLQGGPLSFAAEAATQLLEFFRLGQRGEEAVWLTTALFRLDDPKLFDEALRVLAGEWGLEEFLASRQKVPKLRDVATEDDDKPSSGVQERLRVARGGEKEVPTSGGDAGSDGRAKVDQDDGTPGGEPSGGKSTVEPEAGAKKKPSRSIKEAVDFVNLVRVWRQSPSPDHQSVESGDGNQSTGSVHPRDDVDARLAVEAYERARGWTPVQESSDHPGYDIKSVDSTCTLTRRIEIKGAKGLFQGAASVALSSRQAADALACSEEGVEYWLYVVDSTDTMYPRVFPIPWLSARSTLKFAFSAQDWREAANKPGVPKDDGVVDLKQWEAEE